ncbi:hypothetical protein [Hyphomicrobium sp.]|uniref:hypothetical protein n=1 Tax=Hyphomicrobium sp. TaxID=82 RepID=UPI002D79FE49|nr:hypothetical protein [Hyphomicrobium sp.]HET6390744.1 hypothetical protein [Hyphomicrobium sp.]
MYVAHNVFGPEDLALAESVLDEVWASLPDGVRCGPHGSDCREWLAKQVLASIHSDDLDPGYLKSRLLEADTTGWGWASVEAEQNCFQSRF